MKNTTVFKKKRPKYWEDFFEKTPRIMEDFSMIRNQQKSSKEFKRLPNIRLENWVEK